MTYQSRTKSGAKSWDIAANKTIIVIGRDCWLVLGYTGLAYLDGKPTDQFIAEAISGVPDLEKSGFVGWATPEDLHFEGIMLRIEKAIQSAYRSYRRRIGLTHSS